MKAYWDYFKYVCEHKKNVFVEMWNEKRFNEKRLIWHGIVHDLSKFSWLEFQQYAMWFHGKYGIKCNDTEENYVEHNMAKTRFDWAWQHHKDHNKHHWNYWHERNLERPTLYIRQMIIDWNAMSRKFGGTTQEYYLKNYYQIKMSNEDRNCLESRLGLSNFNLPLCEGNWEFWASIGQIVEEAVHRVWDDSCGYAYKNDKESIDDLYSLVNDEFKLNVYDLVRNSFKKENEI